MGYQEPAHLERHHGRVACGASTQERQGAGCAAEADGRGYEGDRRGAGE